MAFKHRLLLPLVVICIQTLSGDGKLVPLKALTSLDVTRWSCRVDYDMKEAHCDDRGFQSVPQNLPEDTEYLSMRSNRIRILLNSSFQRYPLITYLDISNNNISVIDPTAFYPLKELLYLYMSFNPHLVLPGTGLLRWARKLSVLEIKASNLKSLPNDTLKWSPQLDRVILYYNHLTFLNISSCGRAGRVDLSMNSIEHLTLEAFNFACEIDILDLTEIPLRSVDPNVIATLNVRSLRVGALPLAFEVLRNIFIGISRSHIQQFRLFYCANFTAFPKHFFDPLRGYSLAELDFSSNPIHALYPFVFSNLTHTRVLDLSSNEVSTINPDYFENMQELRVLNLNNNKLKYINPDNRPWTIDLAELHLNKNSLTKISRFTFLGLQNLMLLDMHSNKDLTLLEEASFSALKHIQTIDLSQCNIVNIRLVTPSLKSLFLNNKLSFPPMIFIPGKSFKHLHSLVNLSIRETGLMFPNLWNSCVNVSLFDGLLNLTTLDLSKNAIGKKHGRAGPLSPGVFKPLSALQNLTLEDCHMSCLHRLAFVGLESLQVLNLRGNEILQLHYDIFKDLGRVTDIYLDKNLLSYLDQDMFLNNRRLSTLSLSNNKLTRVNQSTFKLIGPSLLSVDLSLNPIDCDCDISWLLDWMNGPVELVNKNKMICSSASLEPLREKPLLDFNFKKLCSLNILLVCLTSLAVIGLVVIVLLVHYNRWQLRYKLFLLKLAALGYNEMQDARDHNDYEFDMNIIFYDDDEEWIREHLRPALQERLPQFQRNIFGDKNLVLGMHYLDAVDYVVTRSYKTVIVLSRVAVRDRWFMLKFRTAMDHVSDTQTEFVVVIFLEDIPEDQIPFLARLYLSDGRPYLHWPEDVRGHDYFFGELTKVLTINLRTNDLIPNE